MSHQTQTHSGSQHMQVPLLWYAFLSISPHCSASQGRPPPNNQFKAEAHIVHGFPQGKSSLLLYTKPPGENVVITHGPYLTCRALIHSYGFGA